MKNTDLSKMSKGTIIIGIINLTLKFNELIESRGSKYTHKVPSISTLRYKSRDYLTDMFKKEWECVSREIRENYAVLHIPDMDIDKGVLNAYKDIINNHLKENQMAFKTVLDRSMEDVSKALKEFIIGINLTGRFPEVDPDNLIVTINNDENINIQLDGGRSSINYYHRTEMDDGAAGHNKDMINFGTIGSIDMDSTIGQHQLFMMALTSHIDNTIREVFNTNLELIRVQYIKYLRNKNKLTDILISGLDDIVAPYVNRVASDGC